MPSEGSSSTSSLRIVDQRLGQRQPLHHALAEPRDALVAPVGQADLLQQFAGALCAASCPARPTAGRSPRRLARRTGTAGTTGFRGRSRPAADVPRSRPRALQPHDAAVGWRRQIDSRILTSVVLPARLGPITPKTSPQGIVEADADRARRRDAAVPRSTIDLGHLLKHGRGTGVQANIHIHQHPIRSAKPERRFARICVNACCRRSRPSIPVP